MSPRQSDKRSRLIAAAVKLVHEQGFAQTTLAHIAAESGVPLGNVYYYFKTKEAIGDALIEQHVSDHAAMRQQWDADEPDAKARLVAFVDMVLDRREVLARSGCPVGTLCAELHKDSGPLAQQASRVFAESLTWLETQFRALGSSDESRRLAVHMLSVLQGATLLSHTFHDPGLIAGEADRLKNWIRAL